MLIQAFAGYRGVFFQLAAAPMEAKLVYKMSPVVIKPVFGVSDQVRHKPGCTATEDGYRLEISDLGSIGIVLSV